MVMLDGAHARPRLASVVIDAAGQVADCLQVVDLLIGDDHVESGFCGDHDVNQAPQADAQVVSE